MFGYFLFQCAYTMETATSTVVYHRKLRQPSYIYITYSIFSLFTSVWFMSVVALSPVNNSLFTGQTTPQSLSLEDSRKNKYLSSHTEAMLHSLG